MSRRVALRYRTPASRRGGMLFWYLLLTLPMTIVVLTMVLDLDRLRMHHARAVDVADHVLAGAIRDGRSRDSAGTKVVTQDLCAVVEEHLSLVGTQRPQPQISVERYRFWYVEETSGPNAGKVYTGPGDAPDMEISGNNLRSCIAGNLPEKLQTVDNHPALRVEMVLDVEYGDYTAMLKGFLMWGGYGDSDKVDSLLSGSVSTVVVGCQPGDTSSITGTAKVCSLLRV